MFQTCSNSQLLRRVLWISAEQTIGASLKHNNAQPLYIFNRVRVLHLNRLKERTWLHSFEISKYVFISIWAIYMFINRFLSKNSEMNLVTPHLDTIWMNLPPSLSLQGHSLLKCTPSNGKWVNTYAYAKMINIKTHQGYFSSKPFHIHSL